MSAKTLLRSFVIGALALPVLALPTTWNVGEVDHPGQWTIYGRSPQGARLGLPLAVGDFDGDGRADVIITPMNADSGPNRTRRRAGEAIIALSAGMIAGELNLLALDDAALPPTATVIYGADELDFFGTEVFAGDVNGDGYADAIVGAQYGDGPDNTRPNCGDVVIIWGGPAIGGRRIDLADVQPDDPVTFLYGAESGERFGIWTGAGDVDGDGIADVIVGADQANGPDGERLHAGLTYVLYGSADLRGLAAIDMADTARPLTRVHGIDPEDHSGSTVRAFDLNGDGAAELIVGAGLNRLSASIGPSGSAGAHGNEGADGPNNDTPRAGEAYVIYGQSGMRPTVIDLRDPPTSTAVIYGRGAGDAYGEELYAGDFNGDGFGDLGVGALTGDGPGNTRPNGGEMALILGGPNLPGSRILLSIPPAGVTFFYGPRASAIGGDTLLFADLDRDGKDDLVMASPQAAPGNRFNAGTVTIFFGSDAPLPFEIDLANLPAEPVSVVIEGGSEGDILAYSASHGDVDGDGFGDLAFNGMGADGFDDLIDLAGDVYVLSGFEIGVAAGRLAHSPTPTATPDPTSTPTPTPPGACPADCDRNRRVATDELVRAVGVALGARPLAECKAVDVDENQAVTIDELVMGVAAALAGCE